MPLRLRRPAVLAVVVALALGAVTGCSSAPGPSAGPGGSSAGSSDSSSTDGSPSSSGELAESTCWNGDRLDSDPQSMLKLSRTFAVPYVVTARALEGRPAFDRAVSCKGDHTVEVYKVVRLPALDKQLAGYAALLRIQTPLYAKIGRSVAPACMSSTLASAAARSRLPGAVMSPMLPKGATLGWAPASPDQWARGQRVFACTLTWASPQSWRYQTLFTRQLPTSKRTCIDSDALVFVDCARRHDRERIAVIEAEQAVTAGAFPGPKAIRTGPRGRYLAVSDARYRALDAACTAYLRAISRTKKLTGVANVDADEWPAPGGSYPIYCEADTPPDQKSLITQGSVYDR